MTQNADVEWLRANLGGTLLLMPSRASSNIAHIDQLEAEAKSNLERGIRWRDRYNEMAAELAPSVDEIAAHIYVRMMRGTEFAPWAGLWAWACIHEWKKREGADEQKERP